MLVACWPIEIHHSTVGGVWFNGIWILGCCVILRTKSCLVSKTRNTHHGNDPCRNQFDLEIVTLTCLLASCDSGFSTDADDFSDSEQSTQSPVDKESLTQEMPLNRSWTFYYLNKSKNWDERIKKIGDFSTVEGFWRIWNHVKLPTHISVGCDLMIFQR